MNVYVYRLSLNETAHHNNNIKQHTYINDSTLTTHTHTYANTREKVIYNKPRLTKSNTLCLCSASRTHRTGGTPEHSRIDGGGPLSACVCVRCHTHTSTSSVLSEPFACVVVR